MEHSEFSRVTTSIQDMAQREIDVRIAADRLVRHARGHFVYLGLASSLIAAGSAAAQEPVWPGFLTVHPNEMATGTQTVRAGEQSLDSLNDLVYVPPECVGTRRCPLVVFLHGVGGTPRGAIESQRLFADKYGVILLAPEAKGMPWAYRTHAEQDTKHIDIGMKQVLRKYAIEPEKIALVSEAGETTVRGNGCYYCQYSAAYSVSLGRSNADVFSRIASMSLGRSGFSLHGEKTQSSRVPHFYIAGGLSEFDFLWTSTQLVGALRQEGYPVEHVLSLRSYEGRVEDYARMWQWLQESWATSSATTQASDVARSLPVLTTEALTKLTAFWTRFMAEPDSIRMTARQAHQKEIFVPVGQEWLSLWMVDMPALAAKSRPVAAALKAVGLTAQQADAYRLALISATATWQTRGRTAPPAATSVLGRNIAFFMSHRNEMIALGATGMWTTP